MLAGEYVGCVLVRCGGFVSHTCSFVAHVHPVSLCEGKSWWSCSNAWITRRCTQHRARACAVSVSVFYDQSTLRLLHNSVFSCVTGCIRWLFVLVYVDTTISSWFNVQPLSLSISLVCSRFTLFYSYLSLDHRVRSLFRLFRPSSVQIESLP